MKIKDIKQGDLLFVRDTSDLSKAITQINKESVYSHVGIFFNDMIYHATPKRGVNKQTLIDYLKEEKKEVTVYRYPEIDINMVKARAEEYLGLPYNFGFFMDDKGLYCSQYIAKILPIFDTIPMKFGDGINEISDYWKKYYKDLGKDVPLNQEGTNPYQISLCKKLIRVDVLEQ